MILLYFYETNEITMVQYQKQQIQAIASINPRYNYKNNKVQAKVTLLNSEAEPSLSSDI